MAATKVQKKHSRSKNSCTGFSSVEPGDANEVLQALVAPQVNF
jgi:hypothetical protein